MTRILVVEDEGRIASFLVKGFSAHGYTTDIATTGEEALSQVRSGGYDLLLLDIGLPDRDGFSVLRDLREHDRRLPVIILTARDDLDDKVAGLDGGANDYVTKPFKFDELLARVRARLREREHAPVETVLCVAGATLDLRTRCVHIGECDVDLSAREFALAEMFFRHPGQVLSREQILSNVWDYDFDPGSNIVDVYVGYLRKKLGADAITSVRRMGYRLEKGHEA